MPQLAVIACRSQPGGHIRTVRCREDLLSLVNRVDASERPCVFLVPSPDLNVLRQAPYHERFIPLTRTHKATHLKRLMLGQDRIPFVDTHYTVPGKALSAATRLIRQAAEEQEDNIYILGVPPDIIAALASRVEEDDGSARSAMPAAGTAETEELLIRLEAEQTVPEPLARAYIGDSPSVRLVRHLILLAARGNHPVLIEGETGTGKEVVARQIHLYSDRKRGPFITVNCAAIPDSLFEAELFGHTTGAFTGATRSRKGLWSMAHNGTLFLDEIGELPLYHQAKILRVLEDGMIRPVGSDQTQRVQARVLTATNRRLPERIRSGQFRDDLYYRLRAFFIHTPALRDHPEDIPTLARAFWASITAGSDRPLPRTVTDELSGRRWLGNADPRFRKGHRGDDPDEDKIVDAGGDGAIRSPFHPKQLIDAIGHMLEMDIEALVAKFEKLGLFKGEEKTSKGGSSKKTETESLQHFQGSRESESQNVEGGNRPVFENATENATGDPGVEVAKGGGGKRGLAYFPKTQDEAVVDKKRAAWDAYLEQLPEPTQKDISKESVQKWTKEIRKEGGTKELADLDESKRDFVRVLFRK